MGFEKMDGRKFRLVLFEFLIRVFNIFYLFEMGFEKFLKKL